MKIRRCAVLYIEPREELAIDWSSLFAGSTTLAASTRWLALAPHLDREIEVDAADLAAMAAVSQTVWSELEACEQRHGAACVARLLELGLLIGDAPEHEALRERDETLRAQHWRPLAALAHTFSRWHDVRTETGMEAPSIQQLLDRYGAPPAPTMDLGTPASAFKLPKAASGILDETLMKRYTGRNFDTGASLPLAVAARLLQRTFGAQEQRQVGPHANVLKKTSPSGGGLHPVEAFVLVQRIAGVAPGLYYYHPIEHELRPLRTMESEEAAAVARLMVAEQQWLADAPMQVVMVGRIERSFWKYRNHQKAYRALALDAGHLSQTFYLLAAEAGLPAFITAAINDVDIERLLELDHLRHAVIAVCGCGPASTGPRNMVELRYGETGPD
ncbi:putative peptide maturation dehydrogenase [Duganella sp. LjRoot269]|jgi:putative peptide maturation dehydrogenase|uniref:putative peptide maturation dehydrogenase n=1 Tax=Duganella sp. LjRoot269 TaxID=3342305 RepID=UPI003ECD3CF1